MDDKEKKESPKKRKENLFFTIWVHTGYTILVLSMLGWIIYVEYILN